MIHDLLELDGTKYTYEVGSGPDRCFPKRLVSLRKVSATFRMTPMLVKGKELFRDRHLANSNSQHCGSTLQTTSAGGKKEQKEVLLEEHDTIWKELRDLHIADVRLNSASLHRSCEFRIRSSSFRMDLLRFYPSRESFKLINDFVHHRQARRLVRKWQSLEKRTKLRKCEWVQGMKLSDS